MNVSSGGLDTGFEEELEKLFGFWLEGIVLPVLAFLGIAGAALVHHPLTGWLIQH